jgi:hypothetical protein
LGNARPRLSRRPAFAEGGQALSPGAKKRPQGKNDDLIAKSQNNRQKKHHQKLNQHKTPSTTQFIALSTTNIYPIAAAGD